MVEQKIYEDKPYWENVFKVKLDMYMLNMIRLKLSLDNDFYTKYILFKCSKTKKGVEIIQKAAVKIYNETETIKSRVEFSLMTGSISNQNSWLELETKK